MLAVRIVDHDHRELQLLCCSHRAQTDDTCCGLFASADHVLQLILHFRMQHMHKISAVIDDDIAVVL